MQTTRKSPGHRNRNKTQKKSTYNKHEKQHTHIQITQSKSKK